MHSRRVERVEGIRYCYLHCKSQLHFHGISSETGYFDTLYRRLPVFEYGTSTGKESCRVLARGCAVDGFRYKRVPSWMAPCSRNTSPYLPDFTRSFNLTLIPLAAPETGAGTATLFIFSY